MCIARHGFNMCGTSSACLGRWAVCCKIVCQLACIPTPNINWPRGPMDKASAYGAGDCRFESCRGHCVRCIHEARNNHWHTASRVTGLRLPRHIANTLQPAARIELATFWLQARCSATKLNGLALQNIPEHTDGAHSPCVSTIPRLAGAMACTLAFAAMHV